MVLTNITNKRKMAERQPPVPPGDQSMADLSPIDVNMPLAKRMQLIREKQKKETEATSFLDRVASGEAKKTGAKGGAFKTGSFTPFVVFEDQTVESKTSSGGASVHEEAEGVEHKTVTPDMSYTSIKETSIGESAESDKITQHPEKESVVCVFSRRKSPKESTSSASSSDDSAQQRECKDSKDDNHNTVPRKKKKSRRAAMGFPSETSQATASKESADYQAAVEGSDATRDGCTDIETVIEKLPSPDESPSRMSADQIADIDKLFDSLIPDYAVPPTSSETTEESQSQDPSRGKSERRKSTRRASFILPCHRNQPDIPLLAQTDDNTPIHDKKFRLPSSGEDSFTPSSITPVVVQIEPMTEEVEKEKKGSAKRGRSTKKASKSRTKKRVQMLESAESENDKRVEMSVDSAETPEATQLQPKEPLLELDDLTFESPVLQTARPSQAKRRRRSADTDIVCAQEILKTPSPNTLLENLPKITARRSNRIKRRSIEIFRTQLRKEAGDDSPNSSSDGQDTPESAASISKVAEVNIETLHTTASQTPSKSYESEDVEAAGQKSAPSTPDSANVSLNVSIGESPVTTPSGSAKCKTRRGKRKREPSVEDIYRNKLWRTQMPKDKNWETIFEEPKSKKGQKEYQSCKKYKRYCNFDEFYNQNRLKRRRQKALKRGWKPLTKRKEVSAGKKVEEKLLTLDQEMIEEEMPDTSISETLALLGKPLVSLPREKETIVTASPTKSVMVHSFIESEQSKNYMNKDVVADVLTKGIEDSAKPLVSIVIEEVNDDSQRTQSTKSSYSDTEFFTPNAAPSGSVESGKEGGKEQTHLSAISEDDDETFYTPAAKSNKEHDSEPKDLDSTLTENKSKSPDSSDRSSDSLSLTKTPARPEEVADISGVYSILP